MLDDKKVEILAKHAKCTVEEINDTERILIGQDDILPAMEEYAIEFHNVCICSPDIEKQIINRFINRKKR